MQAPNIGAGNRRSWAPGSVDTACLIHLEQQDAEIRAQLFLQLQVGGDVILPPPAIMGRGPLVAHQLNLLPSVPRYLSQHVGGFVITHGRLDELCPIENAAMEDRTIIEWDKDDIDALGLLGSRPINLLEAAMLA